MTELDHKFVLITGGTGLIGTHVATRLMGKGYHVSFLSRNPDGKSLFPKFHWDIEQGEIDPLALKNTNHIIHLAGASVAGKRWTSKHKQEIYNSRIKSTQLLFQKVKEHGLRPETFISVSGVNYYPTSQDDFPVTEEHPPGNDFLSALCVDWENEAEQFAENQIRTVILRLGIVLARDGGAYPRLAALAKSYLAAVLGNGKQYMPWIHIDDLSLLIEKIIEDRHFKGVFNAVAPDPVTNSEFTTLLAQSLDHPIILPRVPSFILKMVLGEMSTVLLNGSRVIPERLIAENFEFQFPTLKKTFDNLG